jgi:hypothetical protein
MVIKVAQQRWEKNSRIFGVFQANKVLLGLFLTSFLLMAHYNGKWAD